MSSNNLDLNSSSSSSTSASTGVEQLCYIPCSFCSIILAVSVPCSSLFDIVTVRCGHCANLWSVNMASAQLHSLPTAWQQQLQQQHQYQHQHRNPPHQHFMHPQLLQHDIHHHHHPQHRGHHRPDQTFTSGGFQDPSGAPSLAAFGGCNKFGAPSAATIRMLPTRMLEERSSMANRLPEKKQRTPSAYNQFIREEIQRIKANNPEISHREAFSTAAKNWAHFPHIQFGLMLENNNSTTNQTRLIGDQGSVKKMMPKTGIFNN